MSTNCSEIYAIKPMQSVEQVEITEQNYQKLFHKLRRYTQDFQQHLTVIAAVVQLAQYRDLDETTNSDFEFILDSTDRLNSIVVEMRSSIMQNLGDAE